MIPDPTTTAGARVLLPVALLAALSLLGCAHDTRAEGDADPPAATTTPLSAVEVERVQPGSAALLIRATGALAAEHDVWLASETGGRVIEQLHDTGDILATGDPILRFDPEPAEIGVTRAEAGLDAARAAAEHAEREWLRVRELHAAGDLTDSQRDQAELSRRSAAASRRDAEASLRAALRARRETVVRAPWPGVLAALAADPGATIAPGPPVARLVSSGPPRITVGLPAGEVIAVAPGDSARVEPIDDPSRAWPARVRSVAVAPDPGTRTYPVEVELSAATGALIGSAVRVELVREELADAILIPQSAVVVRRGAALGFVEQNGLAQQRALRVGERVDERVRIVEGLVPGDRLIVVGHQRLVDGEAVEIRAER